MREPYVDQVGRMRSSFYALIAFWWNLKRIWLGPECEVCGSRFRWSEFSARWGDFCSQECFENAEPPF